MSKVGILTLYYKNDNYGGIAQAYALQKYIENLNYESTLISYRRTSPAMLVRDSFKKKPFKYVQGKFYKFPQKVMQRIEDKVAKYRFQKELQSDMNKRRRAFEESRNGINHTETVYTDQTIGETVDLFDCFVSGSDQIWKPGVIRPPFVCTFLPDTKKRFSYASSIAVSNLSEDYGHFMKNALAKYSWISVREEEARNYLSDLTNREVDVVVDPTLLLSNSEWNSMTSERKVNEDYIFVYLLGQSKKQRKEIQEYAKQKNLRIVFLPHVEGKIRACDINFGDICLYDVNLFDFFSLIKYSEMVITDSFHAVVFSLVFRKNFWVYEREVLQSNGNMGSRLNTLLNSTGLLDRKIQSIKYIQNELEDKVINYAGVYEKLSPIIEKSQWLLKNALEMH